MNWRDKLQVQINEAAPPSDAKRFGDLTSATLSVRVTPKEARYLEYKTIVRAGVKHVFLRTTANAELYGSQGTIPNDWMKRFGFADADQCVAFLEAMGVRKMKRERRPPQRGSIYD